MWHLSGEAISSLGLLISGGRLWCLFFLRTSPKVKVEPKPGECADGHEQCPEWAYFGECQKNPGFMTSNCKKSCKACEGSTLTGAAS